MNFLKQISKRQIASGKLGLQILGALFEWRPMAILAFVLLVVPVSLGLAHIMAPGSYLSALLFVGLNLLVWLTVKACNTLSAIFSLERKEAGITWCQISILTALCLWIIGSMIIFGIKKDSKILTAFGVVGSVTGWIFQDKIKGMVAFIHLRLHHLLNIGDWIRIPRYEVDGTVQSVNLTTVTVYNWDTTTSTFPISALHSDHFVNLQNMSSGKTYGRRMMKEVIIDTSTFHPVTEEEAAALRARKEITDFIPVDDIREGALNAQLFRIYFYHWLMSHSHVSQQPALAVRWLDQKNGGMGLQVYAFLVDTILSAFEWQQSQILEHLFESLEWFGLRLYQAPSSTDIGHLRPAQQPADLTKEAQL